LWQCSNAESTSSYWRPVWRTLESDFSLALANPHFIKQLDNQLRRRLASLRGQGLAMPQVTGSYCRTNGELSSNVALW
jgi:hypothetical protein